MDYEIIAEEIFQMLRKNFTSSLSEVLNEFNKGEIGVLSYLAFDNNQASAGMLSDSLQVSSARIASILNSLESKKYIKRKVDDNDRRKTIVVITEKGIDTVVKVKEEIIKKIIYVIKEIGYDDILKYAKISAKIREVLSNRKEEII